MTHPIIMYELNEVPWRVVDAYIARRPTSHFALLLDEAVQRTTFTEDSGELHPWTTWPTAHRGVYNDSHQIRFINQAIGTEYRPFWEFLVGAGLRVGIFGQLQSYATFPPDPSGYAFYIPDTFAPSPRTHPKRYTPFQHFNLLMTERDGGVLASGVPLNASTLLDLGRMAMTGLRPLTVVQLAKHLWQEQRTPSVRARRSVMQAPLAFDFFLDAYARTLPDYAAFFTNHVAGMMHRYWKQAFPEDFDESTKTPNDARAGHIWHAMDVADHQLGVLRRIARTRGGSLLVMSSMGQEAIKRGQYLGELRINDPARMMATVGFHRSYTQLLAMAPDFAFQLDSASDAELLQTRASTLLSPDGVPMFSCKLSAQTLNMSLRSVASAMESKSVILDQGGVRTRLTFEQLGFDVAVRDEGTGYHQPEGIFLLAGAKAPHSDASRRRIPLTAVAPMLLESFGIVPQSYMTYS